MYKILDTLLVLATKYEFINIYVRILDHFLLYVTFLAGVMALSMSRREMIKNPITFSLYAQSFPVFAWTSTGLMDSLKYILALFLI